jgi:hypothetical protein
VRGLLACDPADLDMLTCMRKVLAVGQEIVYQIRGLRDDVRKGGITAATKEGVRARTALITGENCMSVAGLMVHPAAPGSPSKACRASSTCMAARVMPRLLLMPQFLNFLPKL